LSFAQISATFLGVPFGEVHEMKRIVLATLMAFVFGLFSMPAVQAASVNGSALSSAIKGISPLKQVQRRRRRRRRRRRERKCGFVHRGRSRVGWDCWYEYFD
jgi:hypothetical protein